MQQGGKQLVRVDGFGKVAVHARFQAQVAVAAHGVGRHGQHGQIRPGRVLAQKPGGGQAVHHGHLHVHQHQVVGGLGEHVQCHLSVLGYVYHQACATQQFGPHLLVEVVVVHQQHPCTGNGWQVCSAPGCLCGTPVRRPGQPAQCLHGRVKKLRRADRFGQHERQPGALQLALHVVAACGGHDDRVRRALQMGKCAVGFKPVHAWHLPVHEGDLAGAASLFGRLRLGHRLFARGGGGDGKTHAFQHLAEDVPGLLTVVHHQHMPSAQVGAGQQGRMARSTQPQMGGEPEGAAHPWSALHAHLAAHQSRQLFGDGQPQACAAVFACGGRISLLERAKQPRLLLGREANAGVLYLKAQQHTGVIARSLGDPYDDFALFSELDRVVGVVH